MAADILLRYSGGQLPVHPARIAEQAGIPVFRYADYADAAGCSFDDIARRFGPDGFTIRTHGEYAIFYYPSGNLPRIRWTLAHELGHIFLGHLDPAFPAPEHPDTDADAFAAGILAPLSVLMAAGCTGPEELARLTDLSADAAANRWRDLNRLRRAGRKGSTQDYELLALFSGWITRVRETRGQYEQSLLPPPLKSHRI